MPLFLVERSYAKELEVNEKMSEVAWPAYKELGINWLYSFLSADLKKTYCVYEAPSAEALREASRRNNVPTDAIIELDGRVNADGSISPVNLAI